MKALSVTVFFTVCNLGIVLFGVGRSAVAEPAVDTLVRAQALEIVDEDGDVRSRLSLEESGEVILRMFDDTGPIRVKLGADADGSGLVLLNGQTEPGIQMMANADGTRMTLFDAEGNERAFSP